MNTGAPWHKLADNPEPIDKIYGRELSLNDSAVSKLSLDWDGPRLDITFLVRDLPETLPEKWARDAVNAVAVELRLFALHAIEISKWGTTNRVRVEWDIDGSYRKRIALRGEEIEVTATFDFLYIARVSGYIDGGSDGN